MTVAMCKDRSSFHMYTNVFLLRVCRAEKLTNLDMFVSPIDEPLIDLVTEAQSVVFDAEVGDHLQLVSGENLQEDDRSH